MARAIAWCLLVNVGAISFLSALETICDDVLPICALSLNLRHCRAEAMCAEHCCRGVSVHNAVAWFVRSHVHGLEAGST